MELIIKLKQAEKSDNNKTGPRDGYECSTHFLSGFSTKHDSFTYGWRKKYGILANKAAKMCGRWTNMASFFILN